MSAASDDPAHPELSAVERELVRALFEELVDLDDAIRVARLRAADLPAAVVAEVAELLEVVIDPTFDEDRLGSLGATVVDEPATRVAPHPKWIGPFRVLDLLGEGGMGSVYLAEQQAPLRRLVAVKVMRAGRVTPELVARFESERQVLALMAHPGIANAFEAGTTDDGSPYFVLEYVDGSPITEFCDREKLTIDARLALFMRVCLAVQHAHQKGVIHRDLKPSNVLVHKHDGDALPKVIDFGIARFTDSTAAGSDRHTAVHQLVGTPEYLAPEQASGTRGADDIDTRADVYALGVLLYELMTGTLPLDIGTAYRDGLDAMVRTIREVEPLSPSRRIGSRAPTTTAIASSRHTDPRRLRRRLRGELDWIVGRALEKDRERRYPSAAELAADIARHLGGEPVLARPPSSVYRLRKLIQRNRGVFVATTLVLFALVAGVVGTGRGLRQAHRELTRANEVKGVLADMLGSVAPEAALGLDTTLMRRALDRTAIRLLDGSIADEVTRADLLDVVGSTYRALGAYPEAERQLEALLALKSLPIDSPLRLFAVAKLARVHLASGREDEARRQVEAALPLATASLGVDAQETLELRQIDVRLQMTRAGPRDPAIAAAREELVAAYRRATGPESDQTTFAMLELGDLYRDAGRFNDAERVLRDALAIRERRYGPDHLRTIEVLDVLQFLLFSQGRHAEAEDAAWRIESTTKAILGPDHPRSVIAAAQLGVVFANTGRAAEALSRLERVTALPDATLAADAPDRLLFDTVLAGIYAQLGRRDDAIRVSEQVLAAFTKADGADSYRAIPTRNNLVMLYGECNRVDEAEHLAAESLTLEQRVLGPEHEMTLALETYVAQIDFRRDRFTNARERLERCLPILLRRFGPSQRFSVFAVELMRQTCAALGIEDRSVPLQRDALALAIAHALETDADAETLRSTAEQLLRHPIPELRDGPRALAFARRAATTGTDPQLELLIADALVMTGDRPGAREILRRLQDGAVVGSPFARELHEHLSALEHAGTEKR